jgi:hypothetical protein
MSAVSLQRADLSGQVKARPERLAFGIAVLILLIYSQAAVAPLSGESSDPDASPVLRAIYYPAYAATLFLAVGVWRRVARAMLASPLLIAMVVLAALSGLWSIDRGFAGRGWRRCWRRGSVSWPWDRWSPACSFPRSDG